MSLLSRITDLNKKARARLKQVQDIEVYNRIVDKFNLPRIKVPIFAESVRFNTEGAETFYTGAEELDLGISLPTTEASWDLLAGKYRLYIRLAKPGTLSAYNIDGTEIFKDRRIFESAVIDLNVGKVRIRSTSAITDLSLLRYKARQEGEVIIGPFSGYDGHISAEVVGFGNFTCEVAYDSHIDGELNDGVFIANGSPTLLSNTTTVDPITLQANAVSDGVAWTTAQRFLDNPPYLSWTTEIPVGLIANTAETTEITFSELTAVDPTTEIYWGGSGDWSQLSQVETPNMEFNTAWWTHVWGTASVDDTVAFVAAYDLSTGRRIDEASVRTITGNYLIGIDGTSLDAVKAGVTITGRHASFGSVMRLATSALNDFRPDTPSVYKLGSNYHVPAGTYLKTPIRGFNQNFVIRIKGKGLIKAVDIRIRKTELSPIVDDDVVVIRESLADYFDIHSDIPKEVPELSGPGLFIPTT